MTFIPALQNKIDTNNSTITLLTTSGAEFSGTFTDVSSYNSIQLTVTSNVNSSPRGINIYFSDNNTDSSPQSYYSFTYTANENFIRKIDIHNKYFKIKYSTLSPQTSFKLSCKLLLSNNVTESNSTSIDIFNNTLQNSSNLLDYINLDKGITPSNTVIGNSNSSYSTTYPNNTIQFAISTTALLSSNFYFKSKKVLTFLPTNKIILYLSGILKTISGNITTNIGYFNNSTNGAYFKNVNIESQSSNTTSVCLNSTIINQTNWNVDKLDGSGISKINIDFTGFNIFIIEFFSNGPIKFGICTNGKLYYCHIINNGPIFTNNQIRITYCTTNNNESGATNSLSTLTCGSAYIVEYGPKAVLQKYNISPVSTIQLNQSAELLVFQLSGTNNNNNNNYFPNINFKTIKFTCSTNDIILLSFYTFDKSNVPYFSGPLTEFTNNTNVLYSFSTFASPDTSSGILIYQQSFISQISINYNYLLGTNCSASSSDILDLFVITCKCLTTISSAPNIHYSIDFEE